MSKKHRYYQWLPNSGFDNEVVELKSIYEEDGNIYYIFSNDEICNENFVAKYTTNIKDLSGKMIVELADEKSIWTPNIVSSKNLSQNSDIQLSNGGNAIREIPPIEDLLALDSTQREGNIKSNLGRIKLLPPTNTLTNVKPIDYKDYMSDSDLYKLGIIDVMPEKEKKEEKKSEIIPQKVDEVSIIKEDKKEDINNVIIENEPVAILVNAATKTLTTIPMELNINLPTTDLFNIVSKNFENGAEKFVDVILSHIEYEILKEALKDALLNAYSNNQE